MLDLIVVRLLISALALLQQPCINIVFAGLTRFDLPVPLSDPLVPLIVAELETIPSLGKGGGKEKVVDFVPLRPDPESPVQNHIGPG